MIKKARAAFTRTRINHPRKMILGLNSTGMGGAVMLAPLDGGVTLSIICFTTCLLSAVHLDTAKFADQHKQRAVIQHLGKEYTGTLAQAEAYDRIERSIKEIEVKFNNAPNRIRVRLNKKAQKLADMQQWIIDGINEPEQQIDFKRGRSNKVKNKIPKN